MDCRNCSFLQLSLTTPRHVVLARRGSSDELLHAALFDRAFPLHLVTPVGAVLGLDPTALSVEQAQLASQMHLERIVELLEQQPTVATPPATRRRSSPTKKVALIVFAVAAARLLVRLGSHTPDPQAQITRDGTGPSARSTSLGRVRSRQRPTDTFGSLQVVMAARTVRSSENCGNSRTWG